MNKMKTISALLGAALIALPAFAADDELIVFDWSGYEDPNFFLAYNEKHGDDPTFTFLVKKKKHFKNLDLVLELTFLILVPQTSKSGVKPV